MTDPAARAEAGECQATFGREKAGHSWVAVTKSSYRDAPYTMCSKCGALARSKDDA